MPPFSSFISYIPKRNKAKQNITTLQVSSPFPTSAYGTPQHVHPYASPPILDDVRPAPLPPPPSIGTYYDSTNTPRVTLNMVLDPEPMTDWFPSNFLKSSERLSVTPEPPAPAPAPQNEPKKNKMAYGHQAVNDTEDEEEEEGESSDLEDVLADLEAMDASNFVNQVSSGIVYHDQPQPQHKRPSPSPLKIPNTSNGKLNVNVNVNNSQAQTQTQAQVHILRPSELSSRSRPTSEYQFSSRSPDRDSISSSISGTTIARALMANTFVLSSGPGPGVSSTRSSKYRSGGSALSRMDSAVLPKSPSYWNSKDRMSMGSELIVSPVLPPWEYGHGEPPPPVPGNAELVYVPPQKEREVVEDSHSHNAEESRIMTMPMKKRSPTQGDPVIPAHERSTQIHDAGTTTTATTSDTNTRRHSFLKPPPENLQPSGIMSPPLPSASSTTSTTTTTSSSSTEPPSSAKDLDNILDSYSFSDMGMGMGMGMDDPQFQQSPTGPNPSHGPSPNHGLDPPIRPFAGSYGFRPPFSPITEESSSQLSPPAPYHNHKYGGGQVSVSGYELSPGGEGSVRSLPYSPSSRGSVIGSPGSSSLNGNSSQGGGGGGGGRFFLGSVTTASAGGARVEWNYQPNRSVMGSSSNSNSISNSPPSTTMNNNPSSSSKPLRILPIGTQTQTQTHIRANPSITSIPESVTSNNTFRTSTAYGFSPISSPVTSTNPNPNNAFTIHSLLPPPPTAPAPIPASPQVFQNVSAPTSTPSAGAPPLPLSLPPSSAAPGPTSSTSTSSGPGNHFRNRSGSTTVNVPAPIKVVKGNEYMMGMGGRFNVLITPGSGGSGSQEGSQEGVGVNEEREEGNGEKEKEKEKGEGRQEEILPQNETHHHHKDAGNSTTGRPPPPPTSTIVSQSQSSISSSSSDIDIQQTFPETPSFFSPAFSPSPLSNGGVVSPSGMPLRRSGSGSGSGSESDVLADYLSMVVPNTPMSAFLPGSGSGSGPGGGVRSPLSGNWNGSGFHFIGGGGGGGGVASPRQELLRRAATSTHRARHSRQASLGGRLVKQQQQQQQQQEVQAQRMGMGMGMGKFGQGKVEDVLEEEEKEIMGSADGDRDRDREDASELDKEAKNGRVAMEGAGEVKRKGVVPVVEEEREEGEVANIALQGNAMHHALKSSSRSESPLPKSIPGSDRSLPRPLPFIERSPPPSPRPTPPQIPQRGSPFPQSPTPPQPAAPILGTVNLPDMTPSPQIKSRTLPPASTSEPPTPALPVTLPNTPSGSSMSHGSEEAVLAYDIVSRENSLHGHGHGQRSGVGGSGSGSGSRASSRARAGSVNNNGSYTGVRTRKRSQSLDEGPKLGLGSGNGGGSLRRGLGSRRIPPPPDQPAPVPPQRTHATISSAPISVVPLPPQSKEPPTPSMSMSTATTTPSTGTTPGHHDQLTVLPPLNVPSPIMIPLIDSMTSPTSLPSSSPAMAIRRNDPLVSPSPAAVASAPAAAAAARPTSGLGGARRPDAIRPPPPQLPLPLGPPSSSSLYSLTYDTASSPPPYYSVINSDRMAGGENNTPNTGGSYDANYRFGGGGQPSQAQQPQSPPAANTEFLPQGHGAHGSQTQSMILGPRAQRRARPPLPAGPRRPTQLAAIIATRERNGSVSSVNSQQLSSLPSGSTSSTSNRPPPPPHPPSQQRQVSAPLPPPQFTTPTPKWRGYTMEAAKWTFTSMQLQEIVSRAIRQSSEPSGIRLLQLETLDNEILPELERLEISRTEMIKRYQALTRKRGNLLDVMLSGVDGMDPDVAFKQLEELKEICGSLDKATEELHRVDEQIAQIAQLIQGHSSSALAMALRKLNASFLKQFAEAQGLRQQVEAIQAERDEAWKQAEALAVEFEELKSGKIESPDAENRFEKVMAVRKSSTRATKAGLRSANSLRSNQRASTGSATRLGAGTPSSARTTYADDLPPVPPIPRRRPEDIKTNLPLRNSTITGGGSGEFSTPNSDTRAMVRAQEELYDMLGIPMNERSRRSRSVILPGDSEPQLVASPSYISYFEPPPNTGRRASLPPSAPLPPDPLSLANVWTSDRSGWI